MVRQSGDCLVGGAKVFHTRTDVPRTPTIRAHIQQEVWKMAFVHTYAYYVRTHYTTTAGSECVCEIYPWLSVGHLPYALTSQSTVI